MTIEVRLFATLRKFLPEGSSRTSARFTLSTDTTIADVITKLEIPENTPLLILVNGRHEANTERTLDTDCTLSIFPPIAGG